MLKQTATLLGLLALLIFGAARQAVAVESVTAYVPDDVGICIELPGAADSLDWLEQSQLAERYAVLGPALEPVTGYFERIEAIGRYLSQTLDVDLEELAPKLVGRELVFGVFPSVDPDNLQPDALILTRASDPDLLAAAVRALADAPLGDVQPPSEEIEHAGATYLRRDLAGQDGGEAVFLAAIGELGILTTSEPLMRRVLDLVGRDDADRKSLANFSTYREATAKCPRDVMVRFFVNPRRWDGAVLQQLAKEFGRQPAMRLSTGVFGQIWLSSSAWMAVIETQRPTTITGFVQFDERRLSAGVREFLKTFSGSSDFMQRVPSNATMAFAGKFNIGGIARLLLALNVEDAAADLDELRRWAQGLFLGLDLFNDVLANLGPEVGWYIGPAVEAADSIPRPQWLMRVQVQPGNAIDPELEVVDALKNSALAAMRLAVAVHNEQHPDERLEVQTIQTTPAPITAIQGSAAPPGLLGAFAYHDGCFYGGSSAAIVRDGLVTEMKGSLADSDRFRSIVSPQLNDPSQLLYVDVRALRTSLLTAPDPVLVQLAAIRGIDEAALLRGLADMAGFLNLADTLVAAIRIEDSGIVFSVGIDLNGSHDE